DSARSRALKRRHSESQANVAAYREAPDADILGDLRALACRLGHILDRGRAVTDSEDGSDADMGGEEHPTEECAYGPAPACQARPICRSICGYTIKCRNGLIAAM